ncbi:hypothetical protein [Rubritalea tangerina]|uniref:hypothetical protein n=1 Tax=Rubritalea tangerina TaxID=430798 RepID=UPI00361BBE2D
MESSNIWSLLWRLFLGRLGTVSLFEQLGHVDSDSAFSSGLFSSIPQIGHSYCIVDIRGNLGLHELVKKWGSPHFSRLLAKPCGRE